MLKVYLDAGGWNGSAALSSTEIMAAGSAQWTQASPLPSPRYSMAGANVGLDFYLTGQQHKQEPKVEMFNVQVGVTVTRTAAAVTA